MKAKIVVGAMAIVCSIALGAGSMYAAGQIVKGKSIGEENARNFAYVDAGVLPEGTTVDHTEFTMEKGKFVYDVGFRADDTQYSYLIDSLSGAVIAKEVTPILNASKTPDTAPAENSKERISAESAIQTALSKAGVASGDAVFTKTKLEYDNGKLIYDIEFCVADKKHDYEIDAYTGEILEESSEKTTGSQINPQNEYPSETGMQQTKIGVEKAKQIALSKAGVASGDAIFSKANLDYDDMKQVYDIEFIVVGKAKYEYEIDALTGNVLEENIERISVSNQNNSMNGPSGVISLEEAKSVALQKAGLSAKDVVFSKAKLDRDDGMLIYEIDFYIPGKTEYEYEIDAVTGRILEQSIEPWEWDD